MVSRDNEALINAALAADKADKKSKDPVVVEGVGGTYELYTPVPKNHNWGKNTK